jgi:hypothetical protein
VFSTNISPLRGSCIHPSIAFSTNVSSLRGSCTRTRSPGCRYRLLLNISFPWGCCTHPSMCYMRFLPISRPHGAVAPTPIYAFSTNVSFLRDLAAPVGTVLPIPKKTTPAHGFNRGTRHRWLHATVLTVSPIDLRCFSSQTV